MAADYVTTGQAGKRIGVTSQTIRTWIKAGLLTGYRVGPRNLKVNPAELDALVVRMYGQGDAA
ncbi:helix-turn-helix domain-containing protein [Nocardia sp. CDC159]|uniref:Helix-turn-helix domain-containing protein n=1 Tax=Nocardia pulmonis TaxID=2951408 RepID=A0A9X2EDW1_9NOCA|nr:MULTISPECIES: helix-turn-helix domain-containing protein [Nocardia]MCM6776443.1 helix-turn-helix domain-containing protein [Nocardia pulmonis]MCM6788867.1 helix-turn-helix domain-containing protein [Nocardia sp. CDC159]